MNILVVDDDTDIRDLLADVLTDEGYGVTCAQQGLEALTLLQQGLRPCVILLDLMMPVMNGWQFRAQQQQDPSLAAIPVVVLSAHANLSQEASALQANASLPKPLHFDDLLTKVQQFCSNAS